MSNFTYPRTPDFDLNSFYLEPDEIEFTKIKVNLNVGMEYLPIDGYLHFCSRSVLFCPRRHDEAILRYKYSDGIGLKMLRNFDMKGVEKLQVGVQELRVIEY